MYDDYNDIDEEGFVYHQWDEVGYESEDDEDDLHYHNQILDEDDDYFYDDDY